MPKVTPRQDTPLTERYLWIPTLGSTGRYYDNVRKRIVSELSVRADLDQYIVNKNQGIDALANQLRNREISLADWQLQMRAELREAHNAAAMIAKGGREQMTHADWGRVGRELRTQYEYLDKWAADIASGKAPLDGRLNVRAKLYGHAARGTYEQERRAIAADKGNDEEMRILNAKESCQGCISYAGYWAPIGTLPRIGSQDCRSNCLCSWSYRRSK